MPLNIYVETLKHNRIDYLETRIQILKQTYDRVWYFCDGVYFINGDTAPFKDLWQLLDKYDQFNLYVDDAHRNGLGRTAWKGNCFV